MRVTEQWKKLAVFPKYEIIFLKKHNEMVNKLKREWVGKLRFEYFVKNEREWNQEIN